MIVVCHGVIPITEEIDESISKTDTIYRSVNDVTPYKFNDSARREQNQVMLGLCRAEACLRAKHNGKELDAETGLYYYGARYYDPATALWLGVDPLADKYPEVSPYVYCAGNPVVRIDPDGRWVHIVIGAAVGAVAGAIVSADFTAAGTAGAMAGAAGDIAEQCINIALGEADEYDVGSTVISAGTGAFFNPVGNKIKTPIEETGKKAVSTIEKNLSSKQTLKSAVKEVKSEYRQAGKPTHGPATTRQINSEAKSRIADEKVWQVGVSKAKTEMKKAGVDAALGTANTLSNHKINDLRDE